MKHDMFDLDVQVRSVSGVQPDTLYPATAVCVQTYDAACYDTIACAPKTYDCLQTRYNCVTYTCPTI